jgi:predicted adenine nucleotide alpha hydrolase (AANH) superfamily ATPase
VVSFYFNPNIHPYSEYLRRLEALQACSSVKGAELLVEEDESGMENWFRSVAFNEPDRCRVCFSIRLERAAMRAVKDGFDAFSTTLLYSRYQKHDLIKTVGEKLSNDHGIPFIYRNWRKGWDDGVREYRELGLYRQKYCGCVFSERERAIKRRRPL